MSLYRCHCIGTHNITSPSMHVTFVEYHVILYVYIHITIYANNLLPPSLHTSALTSRERYEFQDGIPHPH